MNELIRQLELARKRSRMLLIARAASLLLAAIIGWLLVEIAADSLLRLPDPFRVVLLLLGLALLLVGIVRLLVPACRFRPSMIRLALRAERTMPELDERLASAIEFSMSGVDRLNPMAASSIEDVERRVGSRRFAGLVRSGPARQAGLLLGGLLVIMVAFVLIYPSAASIGFQRALLPLGDVKWPATTAVVSLMEDGGVHPRGVPLALSAQLTLGDPEAVRVTASYTLMRDGTAVRSRDVVLAMQENGRFERLVETDGDAIDVTFHTVDAWTPTIRTEIVEPPAIAGAGLRVDPPAYARESVEPITLDLGGGTDIRGTPEAAFLEGSHAEITFTLTKPLPVETAEHPEWAETTFGELAEGATFTANTPTEWTLSRRLDRSTGAVLSLVDEHGIGNIEEISYGLQVIPDRPPSAAVLEPRMDETVLPNAVIPIRAEARDDIMIDTARLEIGRAASGSSGSPEAELVREVDGVGGTQSVLIEHDLAMSSVGAAAGDVFEVIATGSDGFALDDRTHEQARSGVRRLVVINDADFTEIIRSQLSSVRRSAIRMESMQREAQDRVRAGALRASNEQARIGERIAATSEAIEEMEDRIDRNRLDDQMLREILRQSDDLLEAAGRASTQASEALDSLERSQQSEGEGASGASQEPGETSSEEGREPRPSEANEGEQGGERDQQGEAGERGQQGEAGERGQQGEAGERGQQGEAGERGQQGEAGERGQQGETGERGQQGEAGERGEQAEQRESDPEVEEALDAQQEVREELEDLISLLDRDEDAWVVTRRVESMLQEAQELLERTGQVGEQTMGRARGDLSDQERSELDRIAERQRDAGRRSEELADELRDRSRVLEESDAQRAQSLQSAARRAERSELARTMQEAAAQIQENRLANAQQGQAATVETLERMLEDLQDDQRARAEQLMRQLASLVQSLERLVLVNEDELIALARVPDRDHEEFDVAVKERSTSLVRFIRNTESVATEARASGQDGQRIARSIDKAADSQALAIAALRSNEPDVEEGEFRLDASLTELRAALELAREAEQEAREEESQRQREDLREKYRELAEREAGVRASTEALEPPDGEELDRRGLVHARRLSVEQEAIRIDLRTLREEHPEMDDSILFDQVHRFLDEWAESIRESLRHGEVDEMVQEREELVLEGLIALASALDDGNQDDDNPFDQKQQQGGGQGGQSGQDELVPPIAELKLLRNMQDQVYKRTRRLAERVDTGELSQGRVDATLLELGGMQEELHGLGSRLLESLEEEGGESPDRGRPLREAPDAPDAGEDEQP